MRNIYMHYGLLIVTLMLAVVVSACGESSSPSSKRETAPTAEERLAQLQKGADSGDADAQFNLGELYFKGEGVPQDYAQARQWWEKAAAQGDAKAQNNLGWLYANGMGVPQDYAQARQWYEKAATQGHADAQVNLGEVYGRGEGGAPEVAQARQGFE